MKGTGWWYSLFPPPVDDVEAQMRSLAIGAFWGLALLVPALVVVYFGWMLS